MKKPLSILACVIIAITLLLFRVHYSDLQPGNKALKVTEWDAFGYYVYLPSIIIYHDYKHLAWLTEIDKKYAVTGGNGWQAEKTPDGNYVFKYLGGVAIMQLPFFLIAHAAAQHYGYPADGFSPPYQYMLAFGVIFYCVLATLLLRRLLLVYFTDLTTAISLLLVCLATNFIQYAAIDNGQSHGYIFPLYVVVLFATMQWHHWPRLHWAMLVGYVIGLATISRPTEAIMLFIPLMWGTATREAATAKWQMVRAHRPHIIAAGICGLLGILPQLIYWKLSAGSFIYDVGSKWEFLSPHFRVLFGWEKGWFIYTPVTALFIAGMFFLRGFQFRSSVLWFCLLNIYIIIAWHDWRYGGSFSTRALVQSYPVFALPLGALVQRISTGRCKWLFYLLGTYLLLVNIFQVTQYYSTVIHYDDMNRRYYSHVYLNPHPSPLDMSLLDNDELLSSEKGFSTIVIAMADTPSVITIPANGSATLSDTALNLISVSPQIKWIKVQAQLMNDKCRWQSYLNASLTVGDSVKQARVRLFSPISKDGQVNRYAFYISVPPYFSQARFSVFVTAASPFHGQLTGMAVTGFR